MSEASGSGESAISRSSPITIGLAIAILTLAGGCIWWASSVSTRLDEVLLYMRTQETTIGNIKQDVNALRDRVLILEQRTKGP